MFYMIKVSLLINILVLAPVCFGIYQDVGWASESYGASSPAKGSYEQVMEWQLEW